MICAALVVTASLLAPALTGSEEGWTLAAKTNGIVVENRAHEGSEVKEGRAVGIIDAPPWVVKNVVDDVEHYSEFMPYTKESRIISRGPGFVVVYQRINPPFVANRDYILRISDKTHRNADGRVVYEQEWTRVKGEGPAPIDGVVRMEVNSGHWVLEELDGGARTRASYWVYTVPGGNIPSWLVNATNTTAVSELYGAVRKAALDPRFRATRPKVPGDDENIAPVKAATTPTAAVPPSP
jgi:hypothetical protein